MNDPFAGRTEPGIAASIFNRRVLECVFLGFTSGLPLYVLIQLVPLWMKDAGVDLAGIGLFTLVGIPYTWKFLWSPLMDRYALPLLLVGTLFSLFQLLLVWEVIPESIQPCRQGVSCKDVQIEWLGFLSIPLLSFVAFLVMNALLIAAHFRSSR